MSEVVVRGVRQEELAEVGELVVRGYGADGFLDAEEGYADELRDVALRSEHAEVLVAAEESGGLLGSVTVVYPGSRYSEVSQPGELEFRMLAVEPSARGRGVGELLVRAVLDRAVEVGASRVVLSSLQQMTTAHRLYRRLGFTRLPELDWRPHPHIQLVAFGLRLPPSSAFP